MRHCTSVSEPDGSPVEGAGDHWAVGVRHTKNHLYGTFTATKERVVEAGRKASTAMAVACADRPNLAAAAVACCGDLAGRVQYAGDKCQEEEETTEKEEEAAAEACSCCF